ncbi:ABC transporter ATP-binding protein, partial [Pseudomonas aeruginosa]|nr:ABC transporter ATP-binding protein [Pseudomonas aeruginosa]
RIVLSGDAALATRLEKEGYAGIAQDLGIEYKEES